MRDELNLVLAGDVMTGRGVDQVLASPSPQRSTRYVDDAHLCPSRRAGERTDPTPVRPTWPRGFSSTWTGSAAVRVMNLETSVTRSDDAALDKA